MENDSQLAKVLIRLKGALEQSRKGEPLDLSEEWFEVFSAIQNDGIAKAYQARLDRPETKFNNALEADAHNWDTRELDRPELREKVWWTVDDYEQLQVANPDKNYREELVDQLVDLFPDIEEAKREERERIIEIINSHNSIGYPYGADFKSAILQALREASK